MRDVFHADLRGGLDISLLAIFPILTAFEMYMYMIAAIDSLREGLRDIGGGVMAKPTAVGSHRPAIHLVR
jgi:hypothetical protein